MAISMLIEKTSRGKASLNRITELLDAPIDVADRDGVADLRDPHGGIEFRHMTFRYPDGEYDVLKDVSFTIKPGESVGIVGKTGAGKPALVDLLLRTYNVPDGTLFVDGQDVNGGEGAKYFVFVSLTTESLTREFPLYTPSLLNLVKTSETHVKGLSPQE